MKIVLQDGIKDCGVCSLLSIIRYYGGDVSKEYLREITNTTKSGVSAYNLIQGAKIIGFNGQGVKGDLTNINTNNLPCLAHLIINKSYQHFVVIYNIDYKKKKVIIMDPAKGKKVMSFSEFRLSSSNNFIYLKPTKKLPVISNKKIILKSIKKFTNTYLLPIWIIIILSILYFLLNLITAFHFKYLLNFAINYKLSINVFYINYYLLIIYITKEFVYFIRNTLLLKMISLFDYEVTTETYKRILLLPYIYYKNRTTGEVVSRIKDLTIVKEYLAKFICLITTDVGVVIIFMIFMFNISYVLAIYVLITILIIFLYNIFIKKKKKKSITKFHKQEEKINSYLIETLTSVETIKGLHIEKSTISKFKTRYKNYLESFYNLSLLSEVNSSFKNNFNNIMLVIVYGVGTVLVIYKKLTIVELFIFEGLLNYFISGISNLLLLQTEYTNYKTALDRIHDMYMIKQEIFNGSKYYTNYNLLGDISFNKLTYGYTSTKLFKNVNLKIKYKQKVLISGPSGTGKSTLVKMLMRYIDVEFGKISINNIDINHYHLEILRNRITYITGSEFLFSDTLYNNIVLNRNVEEQQVNKISKLVMLDEIISKDTLGYQKIVEENGFNFSGGERQRIILCRSLLKDSDIYIFDEALGQIDIERERKILKNIFKYLKDKTVIVISHRFNNEDLFDKKIRLEGGNILEE
ncbi:MAG: ATP-binding cassette domain-containing protein [Firmicutes bacterium]|nr:ATP-binding cassette domain-containing protein [Bacillota bacterium]